MYEFITHRSFAPEHADDAIAQTLEICALCREQPGLISMIVHRPLAQRNDIYLVEQWESESDFRKWAANDTFVAFKTRVAPVCLVTNHMPMERIFG